MTAMSAMSLSPKAIRCLLWKQLIVFVLCPKQEKRGQSAKQSGKMISAPQIRRFALLFLLAAASLTPGCRQASHTDEAQVRLINAVPDAGTLTVAVDGQRVWKGSTFRSSTGYEGIAPGDYSVQVSAGSQGAMLLANRPLSFESGHAYTVLALGMTRDAGNPAQVQVLTDDPPAGVSGTKAGLRLINAAPGVGPLDLVVNSIVGLEAVSYGRRSGVLLLDSGEYDLKVAAADTPDALAGPIHLHLDGGRTYTLVTMGQASNQTLSLEAYTDTH